MVHGNCIQNYLLDMWTETLLNGICYFQISPKDDLLQ